MTVGVSGDQHQCNVCMGGTTCQESWRSQRTLCPKLKPIKPTRPTRPGAFSRPVPSPRWAPLRFTTSEAADWVSPGFSHLRVGRAFKVGSPKVVVFLLVSLKKYPQKKTPPVSLDRSGMVDWSPKPALGLYGPLCHRNQANSRKKQWIHPALPGQCPTWGTSARGSG